MCRDSISLSSTHRGTRANLTSMYRCGAIRHFVAIAMLRRVRAWPAPNNSHARIVQHLTNQHGLSPISSLGGMPSIVRWQPRGVVARPCDSMGNAGNCIWPAKRLFNTSQPTHAFVLWVCSFVLCVCGGGGGGVCVWVVVVVVVWWGERGNGMS